ncbi:MAG TPA: resolvase [Leptolyngbyaceae cyanobacterium M33_DOE_097]|uniref:Resolvase n=1 Tax=Oscillatoriales cyanobacterium SpSt-418 TaxID=2282169 RepID=A0A7C3PG30_9CYAN|nr:resolvase [Leptolyngbyaceae cyanobacterium M33_DOE_097]
MDFISDRPDGLLDVEAVQKAINRSRASVYRYANTDPNELNPLYNPKRLNPELRTSKDDPLLFHPNEVARFATNILKIRDVKVELKQVPPDRTQELLQEILTELKEIRQMLTQSSS